ncbi:hypothetical protein BaRGS_00014979 [Batillaria attramentaria]|uniref:Uncharacterized protein n=1 Tax=Batillaria attramentaria TaxID=370345 RepID=A0ABD0L2T4_9CAEN
MSQKTPAKDAGLAKHPKNLSYFVLGRDLVVRAGPLSAAISQHCLLLHYDRPGEENQSGTLGSYTHTSDLLTSLEGELPAKILYNANSVKHLTEAVYNLAREQFHHRLCQSAVPAFEFSFTSSVECIVQYAL